MSKTAKRLLLAVGISFSCFALTLTWYYSTESKSKAIQNSKEIARLVYSQKDVQKKLVSKIIWQPIEENEILYVGEAIRTSADSEARIEFKNSQTSVDLEPDSAIVLEENDGKLALDFLQGNIQVQAKNINSSSEPSSPITLKSGDRKFTLGTSELTLGKSKSGEINMQVLSGDVTGASHIENETIKIKNSSAQMTFYVNPNKNEGVQIEWEPLPKGYDVILETGLRRSELTPFPGAISPGESGKMSVNLNLGKSFFRLVARSKQNNLAQRASPVLRSIVNAKIPPLQIKPEKDSIVSLNPFDPEVLFVWSQSLKFRKLIIEIARSPNLKNDVVRKDLELTTEFRLPIKKSGIYYWRVSGYLDGLKEVVSSPIQRFKILYSEMLPPPQLDKPLAQQTIPYERIVNKGISFSWLAVPGAQKYQFKLFKIGAPIERRTASLNSEDVMETEIASSDTMLLAHFIKDLKPGKYSWTVTTYGSQNTISKTSERRKFTIETLPVMNWADGKTKEDYHYISLKPSVTLNWISKDFKATQWRINIFKNSEDKSPLSVITHSTSQEIALPLDGLYYAEVEAMDDRKNLLARTPRREINVSPLPLLPAPEYASAVPKEIEASKSGATSVQWNPVTGAKKYVLHLRGVDGSALKEYKFDSLAGSISGLLPGEYKMTLRSVDINGRVGPEGESRMIKVPNQSNVRAPKLKGFKVK